MLAYVDMQHDKRLTVVSDSLRSGQLPQIPGTVSFGDFATLFPATEVFYEHPQIGGSPIRAVKICATIHQRLNIEDLIFKLDLIHPEDTTDPLYKFSHGYLRTFNPHYPTLTSHSPLPRNVEISIFKGDQLNINHSPVATWEELLCPCKLELANESVAIAIHALIFKKLLEKMPNIKDQLEIKNFIADRGREAIGCFESEFLLRTFNEDMIHRTGNISSQGYFWDNSNDVVLTASTDSFINLNCSKAEITDIFGRQRSVIAMQQDWKMRNPPPHRWSFFRLFKGKGPH